MGNRVSILSRAALATMVTGALVFGPLLATPAGASLQSWQARGEGFALRVVVDLSGLPEPVKDTLNTAWDVVPSEVKTELGLPLGQFPFVIDQYFVRTMSDASDVVTKATSILGHVGETAGAWGRDLGSVSADTPGQNNSSATTDPIHLPTSDFELLTANVGSLSAAIGAGPKVDGLASLVSVNATLDAIGDTVPELRAAMDMVIATVNEVVDTANDTIDEAADELFGTIGGVVAGTPLAPVITDAEALAAAVNIPNIPNPLGEGVSLAAVNDIVTQTTALRGDSDASADALTTIKAVDVLDGFLKVGLINLSAHSEAAGTAGSAKNTAACSLADVRIGGDTGVSLDGTNVYVEVGGQPVALPVPSDQVAALKSEVDAVLAQVGVSVQLCDTSQATAAPDGSSASQTVSAFVVTLEPRLPAGVELPAPFDSLGAGDSLGVRIMIDPTVTTQVGATPTTELAAPATLPRTGAPAMATMLTGAMLAAGALALRRRVK